jgi:hypothetical protein
MDEVEDTNQSPDLSLSDILADLKGFGIEDYAEVLTLECKGKKVNLRLSNISTEQERIALLATEDVKGYEWMQTVRVEILSRSISWLNGINLHDLKGRARLVVDPYDNIEKDVQVVLRETLKNWGQEHVMILWRALMVHAQAIEDRLLASFPETAVMTAVQRRFEEKAWEVIDQTAKAAIEERVGELFDDELPEGSEEK